MQAFTNDQIQLVASLVGADKERLAQLAKLALSPGVKATEEQLAKLSKSRLLEMILKYAGEQQVPGNRDAGNKLHLHMTITHVRQKLIEMGLAMRYWFTDGITEKV